MGGTSWIGQSRSTFRRGKYGKHTRGLEPTRERQASDNVFSATPRRTPWNKGNTLRAASGNVHSANGWDGVLKPVVVRYQGKISLISAPTRASRTLRSMSSWKPSRSSMRSACQLIGFYETGSATCSSAQWGDLPTGFIVTNLSRPDRVVAFYNKRGAVGTFHPGCQEVLPRSLVTMALHTSANDPDFEDIESSEQASLCYDACSRGSSCRLGLSSSAGRAGCCPAPGFAIFHRPREVDIKPDNVAQISARQTCLFSACHPNRVQAKDPLRQIDQPPASDAVDCRNRATHAQGH